VVGSLQTRGSFASSFVPANVASGSNTLLALKLHGEDLDLDHGYPCRLIAPARPGVLQTKWLDRVEVLA
jgi:DMSO/TMAO reductase YedYZ molybdopterin-dependent catalytic subunit